MKYRKIIWKDIKIGDRFVDGSVVKLIHEPYKSECYNVQSGRNKIILSGEHYLLCNIKNMSNINIKAIEEAYGNNYISTELERHLYFEDIDKSFQSIIEEDGILTMDKIFDKSKKIEDKTVKSDPNRVDVFLYWIPVSVIYHLIRVSKEKIYCNHKKIKCVSYVGAKDVFCVGTDSHKFEANGFIHHNSVALRNIIFHSVTHGEDISIALVDLKMTEFEHWKGVKNVVAVANTVREATEIARIMREVMYVRNAEMAKQKINDIKDFKPKKPSDEVMVTNHKFNDDDKIEIKIPPNGEIKTITIKELESYL